MVNSQHWRLAIGTLGLAGILAAFAVSAARADGSVSALRKPSGEAAGMGARPGEGEGAFFDAVVQEYNTSGARFRIDGHCQSGCTTFLSIRNVCITPGASLLFHAGGDWRVGRISARATQHMLAAYKPALRQYLLDNHFMETFAFHTISGREMVSRFGYPACR
jgi:hypothetical protein